MNFHRPPRLTKSISLHPKVFGWLNDLAKSEYEGNISAAVTGLILYNEGVRRAKLFNHQTAGHHITKGVPNDPELLDAAIREIEGLDPGFNALTWLEIAKRKAQDSSQTSP